MLLRYRPNIDILHIDWSDDDSRRWPVLQRWLVDTYDESIIKQHRRFALQGT